jgi:hypothetical protein
MGHDGRIVNHCLGGNLFFPKFLKFAPSIMIGLPN